MQRKIVLNLLLTLALLTFPAAAFATSTPSDTTVDLNAVLTVTSSGGDAIHSGDSITAELVIENNGPDAATWGPSNPMYYLPIAEFIVPTEYVTIDSVDTPDGIDMGCDNLPIDEEFPTSIQEEFPGYTMVICNRSNTEVEYSLASGSSHTFTLHATATSDLPDGQRIGGVGISEYDNEFITGFAQATEGENPLDESFGNYVSIYTYTEPESDPTEGNEGSASITLSPTDTLISEGDEVTITAEVHNTGTPLHDPEGGNDVVYVFYPPDFALDHVDTPDGFVCGSLLFHDAFTGSNLDIAHPGYSALSCRTAPSTDTTIDTGVTLTFTLYGTAANDFPDGLTFWAFTLIMDEGGEAISQAFAANEDPLAITGNDNLPSVTYTQPPLTTDIRAGLELSPSDIIKSGDNVDLTLTWFNDGPNDFEHTGNGMIFAQLFIPPEFSLTSVDAPEGTACAPMLVHDGLPGSAIDLLYPGYTVVICFTPDDYINVENGESITFTAHGTAASDFPDDLFFAGTAIGNDPEAQALAYAFSINANPLDVDINNVARLTYSLSNGGSNAQTTSSGPANVLGETSTNGPGSVLGNLPLTGLQLATVIAMAGVLILGGFAMTHAARKNKNSTPPA